MGVARMSREVQVTFDCGDPAALGEFWATALGYRVDDPPEGFPNWDAALEAWGVPEDQRNTAYGVHDPDGAGPRLFFQQVPEGKTAKNRVHLDVRAAPGVDGADRMGAPGAGGERLGGPRGTPGPRVGTRPPA